MLYWFDVIVPRHSATGTSLSHHQEEKEFNSYKEAFNYFLAIGKEGARHGYYYLCQWGKGSFPENRRFGSCTDSPGPIIGRRG